MRRTVLASALVLMMALGLAGCGDGGSSTAEPTATPEPSGAPSAAEGYDPLPIEGPGATEALTAVPAVMESQREGHIAAGGTWPDVTGIEPVLTAYLLSAEMGGQQTLFEVRADGIAHSLYAYQRPFDSGSLIWSPADPAPGRSPAPGPGGEQAAVEAVRAVMADAFEGETIEVGIWGYRFSFIKDGSLLMNVNVSPGGDGLGVETFVGF